MQTTDNINQPVWRRMKSSRHLHSRQNLWAAKLPRKIASEKAGDNVYSTIYHLYGDSSLMTHFDQNFTGFKARATAT